MAKMVSLHPERLPVEPFREIWQSHAYDDLSLGDGLRPKPLGAGDEAQFARRPRWAIDPIA